MSEENISSENYQGVGKLLRDVRESRKLAVKAAASQLNMRIAYIEGIESGDFQALPGEAYARGYIRNYAEWLRMDVAAVLAAYDEERLDHPLFKAKVFIPEPTVDSYTPRALMLMLSALLTVGVYAVYLNFFTLSDVEDAAVPPIPDSLIELVKAEEEKEAAALAKAAVEIEVGPQAETLADAEPADQSVESAQMEVSPESDPAVDTVAEEMVAETVAETVAEEATVTAPHVNVVKTAVEPVVETDVAPVIPATEVNVEPEKKTQPQPEVKAKVKTKTVTAPAVIEEMHRGPVAFDENDPAVRGFITQ